MFRLRRNFIVTEGKFMETGGDNGGVISVVDEEIKVKINCKSVTII